MDWQIIIDAVPKFAHGLLVTVELVALSLAVGLCLAVPLALLRTSRNPLLWMPVYAYIYFMRGTPLLVQIFLIYYGTGQFAAIRESFLWVVLREPYWCAIIAFALNTAGYTAEIFRGAIQAVPHGEIEAAKSLVMSRTLMYRRIILPMAFRLALPAYGNEVILMLQASALASVITIFDITGVAGAIANRTFAFYEMYLMAAALYLALTYLIALGFRKVEFRLSGHLRERPGAAPAARMLAAPGTH